MIVQLLCKKQQAFRINMVDDISKQYKEAQLTLSNPRDAKARKNWSHSSLKQVTV